MHNASHTYNLQSCKTEFIVFEKRLKIAHLKYCHDWQTCKIFLSDFQTLKK